MGVIETLSKGGGSGLKKKMFSPFGSHFGLKIRGAGPSPGSATDNNQNNAKSDKSSNRIVSYIHSCDTFQFNVPSNQNSVYYCGNAR